MVAGGVGGLTGSGFLSSSEVLSPGSSSWREVRPLPVALTGLRAVTFNNHLIVTGGWDVSDVHYDTIYSFSPDSEEWTEMGRMTIPRGVHAISIVNDIDCTTSVSTTPPTPIIEGISLKWLII